MQLPSAIAIMATTVLLPAYGAAETVPDMKGTWVIPSHSFKIKGMGGFHFPKVGLLGYFISTS